MTDVTTYFELKALDAASIPDALRKAERYRLLNEPRDAESICRDILRTDPDNQDAIVALVLSLTDQFGKAMQVNVGHAREWVPKINDVYRQHYYSGVICERWGKAQLAHGAPGYVLFDWFHQAMEWYQRAESHASHSEPDPILRWNACARIVKRNDHIRPRDEDALPDAMLQDDVPIR